MKTIIAIDPGASGGVAWTSSIGPCVAPMPETRGDLIALFRLIVEGTFVPMVAYIEKISGYIPDGGPSAMFEFGRSVERAGCILETLKVPIIEVTPQAWQKALSLGKSDRIKIGKDLTPEGKKNAKAFNARAKGDWKNKLKAEAQRRFPEIKITLKTCDALLLLAYAKMVEGAA